MSSWVIDPVWVPQMNAAVFNGSTFTAILQAAMQSLINSFGQRLLNEANVLTNANPPTQQFPFNTAHMENLLRDGKFKYNQYPEPVVAPGTIAISIPTPQLIIRGPRPTDVGTSVNGRAGINEDWIELNFPRLLSFVASDPTLFPNNAQGQARLEVLVGKTILHEMMHNHGFSHPERPAGTYNPADAYWRTLPEVSEQAYLRLNQAQFPSMATVLNLTSADLGLGRCGTVG
jgi:hypothetical protein